MTQGISSLFDRDTIVILAPSGGTLPARLREAGLLLRARLRARGLTEKNILRLTCFVAAGQRGRYARLRAGFPAALRDMFGGQPPPASLVAMPPERGRLVALEAAVLSSVDPDVRIRRKSLKGLVYSLIDGGSYREVHGAGVTSVRPGQDTSAQAREAFERMAAILTRESMTFGNVVRQWNYIENSVRRRTVKSRGCPNDQAFNSVRSGFYAGTGFPAGLPAATVIGQTAGGVVLEFVALAAPREVRVIPLSSPREPEAPRYADSISSREPGKAREGRSAARAERAKLVVSGSSGLLFVSGMAAVLGQKSLPRHDVESQTRATLDNIGVLIGKNNLRRAGVLGLAGVNGFTFLRAYVRRAADIPKVRRICEGAFGRIPALYIQADICREELLVELEGLIRSRSS